MRDACLVQQNTSTSKSVPGGDSDSLECRERNSKRRMGRRRRRRKISESEVLSSRVTFSSRRVLVRCARFVLLHAALENFRVNPLTPD